MTPDPQPDDPDMGIDEPTEDDNKDGDDSTLENRYPK